MASVISAIMLSAVVLAVGCAVWFYAQGAATIVSGDYVKGVMSLVSEVSERFTVEHVSFTRLGSEVGTLHVWIYNYGGVDVIVRVHANIGGVESNLSLVKSKAVEKVDISLNAVSRSEVAIKVASGRGNNVYYRYLVP